MAPHNAHAVCGNPEMQRYKFYHAPISRSAERLLAYRHFNTPIFFNERFFSLSCFDFYAYISGAPH